jgi:hypothetical protein
MTQQHHDPGGPGGNRDTGARIRETTQQAREKLSDTAGELRDRGAELVDDGRELAEQAGDIVFTRAYEEKERLASGMRAVARALREGGQGLPDDQRTYGRLVERVADRVEGASRYLDDHDVEGLTRDVTRIARDHAPAFLGGAFVLGLVGARFVKSSFEQAGSGTRDARYASDFGSAGRSGSSAPFDDDDALEEDHHARGN